jgi:hypothetical protein
MFVLLRLQVYQPHEEGKAVESRKLMVLWACKMTHLLEYELEFVARGIAGRGMLGLLEEALLGVVALTDLLWKFAMVVFYWKPILTGEIPSSEGIWSDDLKENAILIVLYNLWGGYRREAAYANAHYLAAL